MNDPTAPTPLATTIVDSPIGPLTLVASDAGLRAVLWPDERTGRVPLDGPSRDDPGHPVLAIAATQFDEWFRGERTRFDLPLDPVGTDFQRRVWTALTAIDFGETSTYGAVAEVVTGDRGRARAVGAAIGRNPLSIVVPCHRVVGADGSLTGFAGGLDVKRRLLDHEAGEAALPFP
ncbi:MAG: methylated-DNA--[protein]-cysteine S-methyltransferase [Acidimicrobiales bacterium]|nr:methylated-DNA--[protein]-cysteine S-methyltransferase [Acidimicrobiales bacterium]